LLDRQFIFSSGVAIPFVKRDVVQMTRDGYPGFQGRLIVVEKLGIGYVLRYRG
jgi:hypothetical protein